MSYYKTQLELVKANATIYAPTIKVFANGNGENTNHLNLNSESASEIMFWLAENFLNDSELSEIINKLKELPLKYSNP